MIKRVRSALLCDDLRTEDNNKNIMIGVYADQVTVGLKPTIVPLVIALQLELSGTETEIEVRTLGGGFERISPYKVNSPLSTVNVLMKVNVLVLEKRVLEVFYRHAGEEAWTFVADWTFDFSPTAVELPPAQVDEVMKFAEASRLQTPGGQSGGGELRH